MPAIKKNTNERSYGNAVVNSNVKSYADDPYFIKKAEAAKQTLAKVGLPNTKKK